MNVEMQNVPWLDSDSTNRDCTAELTQPFVLVFFAESLTKECISTDPIQCSDWENEGLVAELTLAGRTDISIHVQLRLQNLLYPED